MMHFRKIKKLKVRIIGLVFLLFCASCSTSTTFNHNGLEREYIFYKPSHLPSNAPLVFALHAYTSSADFLQMSSAMNELADANGFAVVYPQGTADNENITHWNANLTISTTDDVGFLSELAQYLQAEHDLNPEQTFVFGVSNGGFMSYTLACEAPDVFKAIAVVVGTMSGFDWNHCNPSTAVPVLHIHGVDDDLVPIDGSMTTEGGWGGAAPVDEVVSFWANLNGCTTTDRLFLSPSTNATYHRNGTNNNEVWYYKIDDFGHEWPASSHNTGTNTAEVIWQFFSRLTPASPCGDKCE